MRNYNVSMSIAVPGLSELLNLAAMNSFGVQSPNFSEKARSSLFCDGCSMLSSESYLLCLCAIGNIFVLKMLSAYYSCCINSDSIQATF